jgi:hypothetical protein
MAAVRRSSCVRIGVVSRKQDDAADQRMTEALAVEIGQFGAGDIDHQRAERQAPEKPIMLAPE